MSRINTYVAYVFCRVQCVAYGCNVWRMGTPFDKATMWRMVMSRLVQSIRYKNNWYYISPFVACSLSCHVVFILLRHHLWRLYNTWQTHFVTNLNVTSSLIQTPLPSIFLVVFLAYTSITLFFFVAKERSSLIKEASKYKQSKNQSKSLKKKEKKQTRKKDKTQVNYFPPI